MIGKGEAEERSEWSAGDLKRAAVRGVRWTTLARVGLEVINLATAVVLARLISPSEFGLAVVPLIFMPLSVILTFEGFGSALVQRKALRPEHAETSMLASLLAGFAISAAVFALAAPLGRPLFGAEPARLIQLISPIFLFGSLGTVSRAMLWRRLEFARVNLVEVLALAAYGLITVGMAAAGFGADALVAGALLHTLVTALGLIAMCPPPRPRWHSAAMREVARFGLPAAGAGLTYVAIGNATLAVAAVRLAPLQVGLFWRAFQIGVSYQTKISGVMMQLAFPVYSRTEDRHELHAFHERATRMHAVALLPLLSLLIVLAPVVVPWIFGPRWAAAVGPVQVLALAGMIAAVLTGYTQILLAAGRPVALLCFNVFVLAAYLVASWIAAPHGIEALAVAVVAVHVVMMVTVYGVLFRGLLGIPIGRMVTDLLPAVSCSALLVVVTLPLSQLLQHGHASPPYVLAAVTATGAVVFATALRFAFRAVWSDVVRLAARVIPLPAGALRLRRAAAQEIA